MQSNAEKLAHLDPLERAHFLSTLSPDTARGLMRSWRGFNARPNQIAPEGEWDVWILLAGRGFGKTRSGAEWVREQVYDNNCKRIALVGETQKDLEEIMIEGVSGLLSVCMPGEIVKYTKKPVQVHFNNGAIALGYNATQPDQLRGPNFHAAWGDELAKWRYGRQTWDQLQFGLRLGTTPQVLVTTTPRPTELVKAIVGGKEGKVVVTRGSTTDNLSNLAPRFIERITQRYGGTRLGRQELEGEILSDIPNSLWQQQRIDDNRVSDMPDMMRIVIGIDPAITDNEDSNMHGIIVAGLDEHQQGYIIEDGSITGSPNEWAERAIGLYDTHDADAIVVEINQGGDMVANTLRSIRNNIPVIEVRASRGKHIRAEPISAIYAQNRVHHCASFPDLEGQMCAMTSHGYEGNDSPDRLDAMVWALTELFPKMNQRVRVEATDIVNIGMKYPMSQRSNHHA